MIKQIYFHTFSIRYLISILVFITALLPLFSFLPPISTQALSSSKLPPRTVKSTPAISSYDSPNLISTAFIKGASAVNSSAKKARLNTEHTVRSTAYSTYSGLRAVGISTTQGITTTAKSIASGTTYAIKQVSRGTATAAKSVGRGITVAVNAPANAINNMPSAKSFVRPADHTTTPVIESQKINIDDLDKHQVNSKKEDHAHLPQDTHSNWPIAGRFTTQFGVPHWPFQPLHTGIDISSGQSSGVTPVKPFRSGRVIKTTTSNYGLGNYVEIAHDQNGLTSIYAHLHSIRVTNGQLVDATSVLGFEGSTGMSTGTHLHFEIRQSGQPVNPQKYIHQ